MVYQETWLWEATASKRSMQAQRATTSLVFLQVPAKLLNQPCKMKRANFPGLQTDEDKVLKNDHPIRRRAYHSPRCSSQKIRCEDLFFTQHDLVTLSAFASFLEFSVLFGQVLLLWSHIPCMTTV